MADNSTPVAPAAPAASAPGTGTGAAPAAPAGGAPAVVTPPAGGGDPKIPTDPAERAAYFEQRHGEATATITRTTQRLSKYEELFGPLDDEKPAAAAAPAGSGGEANLDATIDAKLADREMTRDIARIPTLVPHTQEIKDLVKGGLQLGEAKETVAKRHNITLGPDAGPMDMMPTVPGTGGTPITSGFTNEQLEGMRKDGIDPEKAKKFIPQLNEITKRALKR